MSERLTTFLKTITDFADEECKALETEAQSYKDEKISNYKNQAEMQNHSLIEHETSRILSRVNREISDYEAKKKASLTQLRSSITEKVFKEISAKINEFTASNDYEEFLVASAKALSDAMNSDEITFFVRPADLKYSEAIKNAVSDCAVQESDEIILGGLKAVDKTSRICGDDTLDTRLSIQRKSFAEKSDLKIY